MALLGEMSKLEGELMLNKNPSKVDKNGLMHSLSYAAQSPWLQHLSIKDNIVFGSPLNEDRYEQVIDACALAADFGMLEDGDSTEIGARGVSLSGGQKARYAPYSSSQCCSTDIQAKRRPGSCCVCPDEIRSPR